MTPFALLCQACGLSHTEASAILHPSPRLDTIRSWASGRRVPPPQVLADLRALAQRVHRAADEAVALIRQQGVTEVELGYAADDAEARAIGWPCAAVQRAALAATIARLPEGVTPLLVPRGSTLGAAAAADVHDRARG